MTIAVLATLIGTLAISTAAAADTPSSQPAPIARGTAVVDRNGTALGFISDVSTDTVRLSFGSNSLQVPVESFQDVAGLLTFPSTADELSAALAAIANNENSQRKRP